MVIAWFEGNFAPRLSRGYIIGHFFSFENVTGVTDLLQATPGIVRK
jgi:hypothetical protein